MDDKVPAALARLWRLPTDSRRGRPAKLDVDVVVRTAADLADRQGLAKVTLVNVAEELGFTKMALYRYVGSKDELFVLMADFVCGPPPQIPTGEGLWREGLRQWVLGQAAVMRQHPWSAHLPIFGPPAGPNQIGWMDLALRILRDTGLDWGAKIGIISVLSGYVRSAVQQAQSFEDGRSGTGLDQEQAERAYGRTLAELVDAQNFPEATKLFNSDVFESVRPEGRDTADADFAFGLELILDGAAATIVGELASEITHDAARRRWAWLTMMVPRFASAPISTVPSI